MGNPEQNFPTGHTKFCACTRELILKFSMVNLTRMAFKTGVNTVVPKNYFTIASKIKKKYKFQGS